MKFVLFGHVLVHDCQLLFIPCLSIKSLISLCVFLQDPVTLGYHHPNQSRRTFAFGGQFLVFSTLDSPKMNSSNRFVQADSINLPEMDTLIILEYLLASEKYDIEKIRAVKNLAASEDHYIEDAIGFVELKRGDNECIVKAKVVPEEPVEKKYYTVSVKINEIENTVIDTACDGCHDSDGGCTHTLLFLNWLQIKASIPERAPVQCFWHKPILGLELSLLGKDIFKSKSRVSRQIAKISPKNPDVLKKFIEECKRRNMKNSLILNYAPPV